MRSFGSAKKKNEFREAREFQISVGLINSLLILNLSAKDRFRKGGLEFVKLYYVEQYWLASAREKKEI